MATKERIRREVDLLKDKMVTLAIKKGNLLDDDVQEISRALDQEILNYMKSCQINNENDHFNIFNYK
ncbi:aspartyl-phosphate phosphatase Spo0E family protein [Orenia marismortui]|uniref:Spo0E like sporulation regulatory protein n=1 Tax=Orenia marismortui TaxID=46469 RepID=A0A4R8H0X4_9FIRM|nr:aspartyl-phosphate phosphatase Spo0E family protein [Orenia marismortui]TDX53202.1 Spo0E like sporulation regulatory protein [Orenia marismortui]